MKRSWVSLVAWVMMLPAGLAWGGGWSVTTADFRQESGELAEVSAQGVTLKEEGGVSRQIAWESIVVMRGPETEGAKSSEPFVLVLRSGQNLAGRPVSLADDKLTWRSELLGTSTVPVEEVRGWTKAEMGLPKVNAKEDYVQLANRDELRGVIDGAEGGVKVQQGAKASGTLKWEAIAAVVLADVGGGGTTPAGGLWVGTVDGSVFCADAIERKGEQLELQLGGKVVAKLPVSGVRQIQNRKGKVSFLAWQEPASLSYAPYTQFGTEKPAGMKVLDEVELGNETFVNVMQIRPKTTLAYSAPADGRLHFRYAAAEVGELTDMALKVTVGEKVVHEVKGYRSPTPGKAVEVPVKKGEMVSFELDYGANFDSQDHLDLLEAAFVAK